MTLGWSWGGTTSSPSSCPMSPSRCSSWACIAGVTRCAGMSASPLQPVCCAHAWRHEAVMQAAQADVGCLVILPHSSGSCRLPPATIGCWVSDLVLCVLGQESGLDGCKAQCRKPQPSAPWLGARLTPQMYGSPVSHLTVLMLPASRAMSHTLSLDQLPSGSLIPPNDSGLSLTTKDGLCRSSSMRARW